MIILLEGPDGSGKTTLANELASSVYPMGFLSLKCGPPKTNPIDEYMSVLDAAELYGGFVIIDRLHLGELVYGPLFRAESRLTLDGCASIEHRLDSLGAIKIAMMPSLTEIERRLILRDGGVPDIKSGASVTDSLAIRMKYEEVLSTLTGWQIISDGDSGTIANNIIDSIVKRSI